jgi:hypothetical protein
VLDLHLLLCIVGLTLATVLFGSLLDPVATETGTMRKWMAACVPWAFLWSIILSFLFHVRAPGWLHFIVFAMIVAEMMFALIVLLHIKQFWPWRDFLVLEYALIALGVTSKQMLAWVAFAGTRSLVK